MIAVFALDPGKTTGYTFAFLEGDRMDLYVGEQQFSLGELNSILNKYISDARPGVQLHVLYEDFEYRNYARSGLDLTPVKMIGIIELYREWHEPFVGFHKQSAATGKAFWSDDKLKQAEAYVKGKRHGRDATRHTLQWFTFGAGGQYCPMIDKVKINIVDDEQMSYLLYGRR